MLVNPTIIYQSINLSICMCGRYTRLSGKPIKKKKNTSYPSRATVHMDHGYTVATNIHKSPMLMAIKYHQI